MSTTKNEDDLARTTADLMGRYCDGEARAFHELYRLLAPRVLAYLASLCNERAAAEDLLQQTFLKLHQARGVYVRGANPIPWLYTIAHRTCLDELRRRKRSRVVLRKTDDPLPEAAADLTGAPEGGGPAPEAPALGAAALQALARLPENQRDALLLTKVHGRSIAEAAHISGTTAGAIKLRAHRGYVTLRKILGKEPLEP